MRPELLKSVGLVAALVILAGCENPYAQQFREEFGWTEARMVSDGWLKGRRIPVNMPYCYGTIGVPDCYALPQRGQRYRLINKDDQGSF